MKDGVDAAVADPIREALRFLQAGGSYHATIDTHEIAMIRRADVGFAKVDRFCVVCVDCRSLLAIDATLRSVLVHINKHTEGNDRNDDQAKR